MSNINDTYTSRIYGTLYKNIEPEINTLTFDLKHWVLNQWMFYRKVVIERKNCRLASNALIKLISTIYKLRADNGILQETTGSLNNKIFNGNYFVPDRDLGDVYIDIRNDIIIVSTWYDKSITSNDIIKFINKIYLKYYGQTKHLSIYLINEHHKWRHIKTCPLKLNIVKNSSINQVESYIDSKYNSQNSKIGILLYGPSGTGKSTMIEYIASKYEMGIYMVTLNNKDLYDSRLLELFMLTPPNSLLVLEELDDQLDSIINNTNVNVTIAGIKLALDGPQRSNNNVITIITTNNKDKLLNYFNKSLLRYGRIDAAFELSEVYNN